MILIPIPILIVSIPVSIPLVLWTTLAVFKVITIVWIISCAKIGTVGSTIVLDARINPGLRMLAQNIVLIVSRGIMVFELIAVQRHS